MRYSEFETEKEFKKYLRREKILMAEYFEKFEPRYDLYSNEKIKYKDRASYLSTYFTHKRNMSKWLKIQDKDTALSFIKKGFNFRKQKDELQFVPCQVEARNLKEVPSINAYPYIHEVSIWEELGLKQRFSYEDLKYKFEDLNGAVIGIDTREKNRLDFKGIKTIKHKFDFGDYGFINEPYFCNTFFERKSITDLWGTMSKGYDRFCREIERADNAGAYIIVMIDYAYSKATGYNYNKRYSKSTSNFIFHRIRKMLQTYDNVQFLFSGGREQSEYLITKIGMMGENAKKYDLQYLLDTKKNKMIEKGNFGLENPNIVDEMLKVQGDLTQAEAAEMVAKLLASKPGLLYNMLTGGENLFSYQIAKIAILAKRDFTLDVSARGGAKTFTAAVFALIYAITHPGIKILVLGPTLRQAKTLLNYIMDIAKKPNAFLLRQFLTDKSYKRDPDRYSIKIGTGVFGPESEIFAMALGDGKKIRGARAQVIILDEAFAIPQNIIDEVIGPMMIVNANISERVKTKELEDKLIKSGKMQESERRRFANNKMIMLSSACYEFESFYKRFESYRDKILDPNLERQDGEITYGIVNLGWEAHPDELLSKTFVLREQESMSEDSFRREYEAQFSPDSASYFKMSVMAKRTLSPGEYPHVEIRGDDPSKYFYILGIDPNFSNSETSDNYAMALLKVERGKQNKATLVHNYAVAGLEADNIIEYVIYLITHFNIEYIIMDFAGARQSLDTWNNSSLFKERNLKLEDFEAKFDSEKDVRDSKSSYDLGARKIVHIQNFNTGWIREANEYMQMCFDRGKLFFASSPIDSEFESMVRKRNIPIDKINYLYGQENEDNFKEDDWLKKKQYDFIEHQVRLISQSKTECANVKMTASPQGHQTFDLPTAMRKMNTPDKPRKDSYSALLLANWGRKCYELLNETDEEEAPTWVPPMMF